MGRSGLAGRAEESGLVITPRLILPDVGSEQTVVSETSQLHRPSHSESSQAIVVQWMRIEQLHRMRTRNVARTGL